MSLQPSQNAISQGTLGMEAYPNGRATGSAALRARSPHSERLKQPSESLPDQVTYLNKQPSSQIQARGSEDSLSLLSETDRIQDNESGAEAAQRFGASDGLRPFGKQPAWRMRLNVFWIRNKGVLMVLLAELFSAFMITATRLLETEDNGSGAGMEPFQVCHPHGRCVDIANLTFKILLARMGITALLSMIYMWWTKMPDAPFGARGIRHLLVIRGLMGLFGGESMIFALYLCFGLTDCSLRFVL